MLANHLLQNIPHLGAFPFNESLRRLDRGREATNLQFAEDKWLEQFKRHLLGQPALMKLQRRTDDHNRTPRIVDALSQQILSKSALFPLDHVRRAI